MYCCNCGKELEEEARFCSVCGTAKPPIRPQTGYARQQGSISRIREGRKIAGVCGGVARYFEIDVTLIRVLWVIVTLFLTIPFTIVPGLLAYIVCWIAMPQDPLPVFRREPSEPASTSQAVDA
jgi:phage shock protein C